MLFSNGFIVCLTLLIILTAEREEIYLDSHLYHYFRKKWFLGHSISLDTLAVGSKFPVFVRLKKNGPLSLVKVRMIIFSINKKGSHKDFTKQSFHSVILNKLGEFQYVFL